MRLVTTIDHTSCVSPLYFQQPVSRVVKSEFKKEQEALAEIAAKEDTYKITAQYVESLTAFIPELINLLFSRKITMEAKQVTYTAAQHLVRNIY